MKLEIELTRDEAAAVLAAIDLGHFEEFGVLRAEWNGQAVVPLLGLPDTSSALNESTSADASDAVLDKQLAALNRLIADPSLRRQINRKRRTETNQDIRLMLWIGQLAKVYGLKPFVIRKIRLPEPLPEADLGLIDAFACGCTLQSLSEILGCTSDRIYTRLLSAINTFDASLQKLKPEAYPQWKLAKDMAKDRYSWKKKKKNKPD